MQFHTALALKNVLGQRTSASVETHSIILFYVPAARSVTKMPNFDSLQNIQSNTDDNNHIPKIISSNVFRHERATGIQPEK